MSVRKVWIAIALLAGQVTEGAEAQTTQNHSKLTTLHLQINLPSSTSHWADRQLCLAAVLVGLTSTWVTAVLSIVE
ncbi:MAG: hypothetical protein KME35_18340 [Aphanocapsa sp. GSE-SYN-MK-11-07L]|nr:hypothetical protein [Aphanocapsa sp. GSE-SYN-MK-11-07L]